MHLSIRYYYAKQLVQVVNAKRYIINIAGKLVESEIKRDYLTPSNSNLGNWESSYSFLKKRLINHILPCEGNTNIIQQTSCYMM